MSAELSAGMVGSALRKVRCTVKGGEITPPAH